MSTLPAAFDRYVFTHRRPMGWTLAVVAAVLALIASWGVSVSELVAYLTR
jgi:hypothetical protein